MCVCFIDNNFMIKYGRMAAAANRMGGFATNRVHFVLDQYYQLLIINKRLFFFSGFTFYLYASANCTIYFLGQRKCFFSVVIQDDLKSFFFCTP